MRNYYDHARICQDCGSLMVGVACNRKRCDACRDVWKFERKQKHTKFPALPPPSRDLDAVANAATAAGMSYGYYAAHLEGRC